MIKHPDFAKANKVFETKCRSRPEMTRGFAKVKHKLPMKGKIMTVLMDQGVMYEVYISIDPELRIQCIWYDNMAI